MLLLSGCASQSNLTACGTVSAYVDPQGENDVYRVVVTHLNGKPVISRPNYTLPVGRYEFTLAELISSPDLKVALSVRGTKKIMVNVEQDVRYHLAAKFKTDKTYVGNNPDYWQPIILQQTPHTCELQHNSAL
ncbi:hypothetical protein ACFOD0_06615 [Shewanella intestini]|uniref:hypothetical protein n=1 Tax=Shewanella TaxID=22 RepID=UPI002B27924A|nr:hypothetical protein [Shewanella sp. XMDDZSB0408]